MRISDCSSDVCSSDLQSPKSPRRWIRVDLANGEQTVVQQQKIANFDPDDYQVERLFAPAPDGEMVPIILLSRRGAPKDGKAPLLQYGYGASGVPSDPEFSIPALAPVDSGWRYAIAHVRGGRSEERRVGKEWVSTCRSRWLPEH